MINNKNTEKENVQKQYNNIDWDHIEKDVVLRMQEILKEMAIQIRILLMTKSTKDCATKSLSPFVLLHIKKRNLLIRRKRKRLMIRKYQMITKHIIKFMSHHVTKPRLPNCS